MERYELQSNTLTVCFKNIFVILLKTFHIFFIKKNKKQQQTKHKNRCKHPKDRELDDNTIWFTLDTGSGSNGIHVT